MNITKPAFGNTEWNFGNCSSCWLSFSFYNISQHLKALVSDVYCISASPKL